MLALTLTSETRQKLESLNCDQIIVLSSIAKGLTLEVIATKWCMSNEKVWRVDGEIREVLGDDAGTFYREYGRELGFTDDGKGALRASLRKKATRNAEGDFEDPMPDTSMIAERISELETTPKKMICKILEGVDVEDLWKACGISRQTVADFMPLVSRTIGIIPRRDRDKMERWRQTEKMIRELDFTGVNM